MMRLDAESAWFWYLEEPEQPMTIVSVAVLGPGDAVSLRYLSDHLARRLHRIPAFRWRVVAVPCGIHHPVRVEDPDFDLGDHLRRASLPAGSGEPDRLDRFCARLADCHLDRRHPLWQLTLVDDVPGGRQALVLVVHHCLMDGYATANALREIFSAEDHDVTPSWVPDMRPSRARLVADAGRDHLRSLVRIPGLVRSTRLTIGAVRAREHQSTVAVPKPATDTPWCSLHRARTFGRALARLELPLADVRMVKEVAGATVNDVVLAIVAGSLRSYLRAHGDLPERPLIASIPVGFDRPGASSRTSGNRLSLIPTSLATHVDEPWQRLVDIVATTGESKLRNRLQDPERMVEWLDFLPPFVAAAGIRRHRKRRRTDPHRVEGNVVVSNIRGPAAEAPWHLGSLTVEELHLAGPMTIDEGADVLVWDYRDRLLIAVMSFTEAVATPADLAGGMRDALSELVAIATRRCSADVAM